MNTIKSINFGLDVCSEMQPDFPIKRTCEKQDRIFSQVLLLLYCNPAGSFTFFESSSASRLAASFVSSGEPKVENRK